jgi:hypothetical protein
MYHISRPRTDIHAGGAVMEWLLYNDERQEFLFVDEWFLQGLRSTFEDPSDDSEYVDEFDELERRGWRKATPLTVAMALGEVYDEGSLAAWVRSGSDQTNPSSKGPCAR